MTDQIIKTLRDIPVDAMRRASLAYAIQVLRASGEAGTESACLLLQQHIDELRDAAPNAFPDPYETAALNVVDDWGRGSVFHVGKPPSEAAPRVVQNGHLRSAAADRAENDSYLMSGGPRFSQAERLAAEMRDGTVKFIAPVEPLLDTGRTSYKSSRSTLPRGLEDALPHVTPDGAALDDLEGRAPTDVVITDELVREFRDAYATMYPAFGVVVVDGLDRYLALTPDLRERVAAPLVRSVHSAVRHWLKHNRGFRRG